jgi:hypothetical protein
MQINPDRARAADAAPFPHRGPAGQGIGQCDGRGSRRRTVNPPQATPTPLRWRQVDGSLCIATCTGRPTTIACRYNLRTERPVWSGGPPASSMKAGAVGRHEDGRRLPGSAHRSWFSSPARDTPLRPLPALLQRI